MNNARPDWDDYLMALAFVAAQRSHDPETRHGAVIVDHNHRVLGLGYNGLPRVGDEARYPLTRPEKYPYMLHAELNALLNCAARPSLGTLYVTGLPCPACTLALIQQGIKRIVFGPQPSASVGDPQRASVDLLAHNHGVVLDYRPLPPLETLRAALAQATALADAARLEKT